MKLKILPDGCETVYYLETERGRDYAVRVSANQCDEQMEQVLSWYVHDVDTLRVKSTLEKEVFTAAEVADAHRAAKELLLQKIVLDVADLEEALRTVNEADFLPPSEPEPEPEAAEETQPLTPDDPFYLPAA